MKKKNRITMKKKNRYKITFYFTNNINTGIDMNSELGIKDFANDFSNTYLNKKFVTLIDHTNTTITITVDNILFYTVKLLQDDATRSNNENSN